MSRESLTDEQKKKITDEAYRMTMLDLSYSDGDDSLYEAEFLLKELENKEMYEECAGVHRALDTYRFIKNFYTVTEKTDLSDKIKLDYDKDS